MVMEIRPLAVSDFQCAICRRETVPYSLVRLHSERSDCESRCHRICLEKLLVNNGTISPTGIDNHSIIYTCLTPSFNCPTCSGEIDLSEPTAERLGLYTNPQAPSFEAFQMRRALCIAELEADNLHSASLKILNFICTATYWISFAKILTFSSMSIARFNTLAIIPSLMCMAAPDSADAFFIFNNRNRGRIIGNLLNPVTFFARVIKYVSFIFFCLNILDVINPKILSSRMQEEGIASFSDKLIMGIIAYALCILSSPVASIEKIFLRAIYCIFDKPKALLVTSRDLKIQETSIGLLYWNASGDVVMMGPQGERRDYRLE